MNELYEMKEKLCKQLKDYHGKDLTSATLDVIDKLTHTIKNLDKIIEKYEEKEYGNSYSNNSYANSYNGPYNMYNDGMNMRGNSYARGGNMGRYSRSNDMIYELTELMEDAPDDRTRMEFQRFIQKMQNMQGR